MLLFMEKAYGGIVIHAIVFFMFRQEEGSAHITDTCTHMTKYVRGICDGICSHWRVVQSASLTSWAIQLLPGLWRALGSFIMEINWKTIAHLSVELV